MRILASNVNDVKDLNDLKILLDESAYRIANVAKATDDPVLLCSLSNELRETIRIRAVLSCMVDPNSKERLRRLES